MKTCNCTPRQKYEHLLSPINVGGIWLRNRMMTTSMSPGEGYTDAETHKPTQMFLNYLEERAAGGFDLICQTVMMYPQTGLTRHPVPWAFSDEYVDGLSSMSAVVHMLRRFRCGEPCHGRFRRHVHCRQQ